MKDPQYLLSSCCLMRIAPRKRGVKQHTSRLFTVFPYDLGDIELRCTSQIKSDNIQAYRELHMKSHRANMTSSGELFLHVLTVLSQCVFERGCSNEHLNQKLFTMGVWATCFFLIFSSFKQHKHPKMSQIKGNIEEIWEREALLAICSKSRA